MGLSRTDYRCTVCGDTHEEPFNESSFVGYCYTCDMNGDDRLSLFKKVWHVPTVNRVWHEHHNITTGQLVSDRRQMQDQLDRKSDEVSERLNGPHSFQMRSVSEITKDDTGLDATHNAHVAMGIKPSRGKFVFPMKD